MTINRKADKFKQAHQLEYGDIIALHYGKPAAEVIEVQEIQDANMLRIVIEVPDDEPVRYFKKN